MTGLALDDVPLSPDQIAQINAEMADDILIDIGYTLSRFECLHGDGAHAATPPLMFPEWIGCIVQRAYARGADDARKAMQQEAK